MSTFTEVIRVLNPQRPEAGEELNLLVDTGASFSWISRNRLDRLGIKASHRMPFRTIEGRTLERDMAEVRISKQDRNVPDLVVMAEAGEMEVIGAHSIEALGMAADPVQGKLVPTVMLALGSTKL